MLFLASDVYERHAEAAGDAGAACPGECPTATRPTLTTATGASGRTTTPTPPPPDPKIAAAAQSYAENVTDEGLRGALEALARNVLSKAKT